MSADGPYFGIDFGTTNSSMAWYDPEEKRANVLLNSEGEYKTPSLVYFGEEGTLVGRSVEDLLIEVEQTGDPKERDAVTSRIVKSIKRNLITPPVIPITGEKVVRPAEVVAEILRKLKHDAEEEFFHEPVSHVVITCPAVFDTKEQQVLLDAAAKVGFKRVEVLEEPTAAAITVTKRAQKVGDGVLVYDLGAGTFDLSVVTRAGDGAFYSPVEPQGDPRCGGDDLDLVLYRYCEEIAQEQLGRAISLSDDIDQVFLRQCRSRKENLTRRDKVKFASWLTSENGPVSFKYEVERETFEGLIRPRLMGTVTKTAELFEQVKDRVDTVILIGGSSQVPLVERLLGEELPIEPRKFAEKEDAVALGAAYHAYEVFGVEHEPVKEYRKALKICWEDRKFTETEIGWLGSLKEKLDLDVETTARIERQVMGATIEQVLERQIEFAQEQYKRAVRLGWKDKKLGALKSIPSARLDMLLGNRELFRDYDFDDSPVSAAERKALVGNMPWNVFVMAVRVATDPELSSETVADILRTIADDLGMNEQQAREAERNVLGGHTVKDILERRAQEEYRKKVATAWRYGKLDHEKVNKLKRSASSLGLSEDKAEGVERSVMDSTAYEILAEDNQVLQLLQKHKIDQSKMKGSGKNGRITKRDVEWQVQSENKEEQERKKRERKAQEKQRKKQATAPAQARKPQPQIRLSVFSSKLDTFDVDFVPDCTANVRSFMASDSSWSSKPEKLGECIASAVKNYENKVTNMAREEVRKTGSDTTVRAFSVAEQRENTKIDIPFGAATKAATVGAAISATLTLGADLGLSGAFVGGTLGKLFGKDSKEKTLEKVQEVAAKALPELRKEANNYLINVAEAVNTTGRTNLYS